MPTVFALLPRNAFRWTLDSHEGMALMHGQLNRDAKPNHDIQREIALYVSSAQRENSNRFEEEVQTHCESSGIHEDEKSQIEHFPRTSDGWIVASSLVIPMNFDKMRKFAELTLAFVVR